MMFPMDPFSLPTPPPPISVARLANRIALLLIFPAAVGVVVVTLLFAVLGEVDVSIGIANVNISAFDSIPFFYILFYFKVIK